MGTKRAVGRFIGVASASRCLAAALALMLAATAAVAQDTTAPAFSSATVNGKVLTVTFDKALKLGTPAGSALSVTATNLSRSRKIPGTGTAYISGTTVTVRLESTVLRGEDVEVDYTQPATSPLQDADAKNVDAFTGEPVDNLTDLGVALVGNFGQADGGDALLSFDHRQDFTTGSYALGYTLHAVDLELLDGTGTAALPTYEMGLYLTSDLSTKLGALYAERLPPKTPAGAGPVRFWAEGGGIDLSSATTYSVVLDVTANPSANATVGRTTANAEDAGAAPGWTVADSRFARASTGGTWTETTTNVLKLTVHGWEKSSTPLVPLVENLGQAADGTADLSVDNFFVFVAGRNPDGYRLHGVDLEIRDDAATTPTFEVKIADSAFTLIDTLTRLDSLPTGAHGRVRFRHADGIDLDPGEYVLWIDVTADPSGDTSLSTTTSDDEDPGGAQGFSLRDNSFTRKWDDPGGSIVNHQRALRIAVRGEEKVNKPPEVAQAELTANAPPGTITFVEAVFSDPEGGELTFEVSADRGDDVVRLARYLASSSQLAIQMRPQCALMDVVPALPATFETVFTVTATDPGGQTAQTRVVATTTRKDCAAVVGAVVDGNTLTVSFDRALDADASVSAGDFTVTVDGASRNVTAVTRAGSLLTLTFDGAAVTAGQAVTVAYESGSGSNPVRSFTTPETAANVAGDVTAPQLAAASMELGGPVTIVTLAYDELLDPGHEPAVGAFTVSLVRDETIAMQVTHVEVVGRTAEVGVNFKSGEPGRIGDPPTPPPAPLRETEQLLVSYAAPASGGYRDFAGNLAAAFQDEPAAVSRPPDPESLRGAVVNGDTLTLIFAEALFFRPKAADFAVTVAGSARNVTAVTTSNTLLKLTLESAVSAGEKVTVAYAPWDASPETVLNVVGDTTGPRLVAATADTADGPTLFLVLTYDELLDESSVPGTARLQVEFGNVRTNGGPATQTPEEVAVRGRTVILTLRPRLAANDVMAVSFRTAPPDPNIPGSPTATDYAGNPAAALASEPVTHGPPSAPTPPPTQPTPPPTQPNPPSGGGGSGEGGGGDRRPEVAAELEDRAVALGAALALDLSGAFRSPGGGALTFSASSSDPAVADVEVDGATLTVRARADGEAEIAVTATDGEGRSITQRFRVAVTAPEAAFYLPPASDPYLQGFVRVVNRSGRAGEVQVAATDDAGTAYGPLALALDPHQARHFNSRDLEDGNPAKGLAGSTGPGSGGWRLEFGSETLDVEALAHLRTADGFVTAMGATAPKGADGRLRLATFNPASNWRQVSLLRLVNPSDGEAKATVTGVDDAGESPGSPVMLTLPAGTACEVDATALETGRGLACGAPQAGLGDGEGKWRLAVESDAPIVAMGLLRSPTGHLTNLSGSAAPDADGTWRVPLFPPASDAEGRQGFVRVISRSSRNGTVRVAAFDDTDFHYEPLTLRLDAGEAVHFNADDLELGNRGKGLVGSTGPGAGTWRLELSSDFIDFEAYAYVRHRDGFLTAMQAAAASMPAEPPGTGRVHRVATLNPGSNWRQVGVLRLVNRGAADAAATVTGADDRGVRPGGPVEVRVPASAAVELTAAELESGVSEAIASGALGDGAGKWRLRVESEGDLAVMGLLRSPMGHLSNLSRSGAFGALPSVPAPPAWVAAEDAGQRRVRAEWAEVPGMRYGVELLLEGEPLEDRSLAATARRDFRWSGLEPGTYSVRVRSVDADRTAGPWGEPSNEVAID